MTTTPAPSPPMGPRMSLLAVLQQAQLKVATLMMLSVGVVLTLAALMALRTSVQHNLQLMARSIAYTTEAAVVFRDTLAIQESLELIAQQEALASADIVDSHGMLLGQYQRPSHTLLHTVGDRIAALLLPQPSTAPVVFQGKQIGTVRLRGNGAGFVWFIGTGLAGLLACVALGGLAVRQLSRQIQRDIMQPVEALIAMTDTARREHHTSARAPATRITELHQLGEDFNALLVEIAAQRMQMQQDNQSLAHLANHDSLTGLPNRAYFRRRLTRALQDNPALANPHGSGLAVLYLDNDHFKQVNDQHGHAAGDALLVEVAHRVLAQVRENDVVARLGGDEFAILLAPLHNTEDAARIADKIIASMATPLALRHGAQIVPSLSIGIAIYPLHGHTAEQLLRAADRAMYRVKTRQRGGHHIFNAHTDNSDFREPL